MISLKTKIYHIGKFLSYVILIIINIFLLFPIYFAVSSAFKSMKAILSIPPKLIPGIWDLSLQNFIQSFKMDMFPGVWNSLIIASFSSVLAVFFGTLAAYSLERFSFKAKENIAFWILSLRMIPPIAVIIPIYLMLRSLHLLDVHFGVILMHLMFNLPFVVWIMRGFIKEVPYSLEQAAMMDGFTVWGAFSKVCLPLIRPGMLVSGIFSFIFSWNEFLFSLVLTRKNAITLPVSLSSLSAAYGVEWGRIMALSFTIMVPIFILYLSIQKYLVRGLTFGAVK